MNMTDSNFFSTPPIATLPPDTVLFFTPQARGNHGRLLKSTSGWDSNNGSNALGFNTYPSGYYEENLFWASAIHLDCGRRTSFWTATKNSQTSVLIRSMSMDSDGVFRSDHSIGGPISRDLPCRCVKD
jgi:uncharacterized protein (TIGR02145 family)